ncbi:MAG TPA: hypothetical protein VGG20_01855 [Thermoanaerobaculia bacterium]
MQSTREADPPGAVVVRAEAELGDLDLESIEVEGLLLGYVQPPAVQMDVTLGVDRKLFDVEGGPVEAAEEGGKLAGDFGGEEAVVELRTDGVKLDAQDVRFRNGRQPARAAAGDFYGYIAVEVEANIDFGGFFEERKQQFSCEARLRQRILPKYDLDMLEAKWNPEQALGAGPAERLGSCVIGRCIREIELPAHAARPDDAFLQQEVFWDQTRKARRQLDVHFLEVQTDKRLVKSCRQHL